MWSVIPSSLVDEISGIWENCRAAYEDIVKHLERATNTTLNPTEPVHQTPSISNGKNATARNRMSRFIRRYKSWSSLSQDQV
ncbi:hypothetical protein HUJ04_010650 [Dendroctonus ponderosae]|nr:hypothetical protein HUJ04_010650 [Dendroctonus ponderosae]